MDDNEEECNKLDYCEYDSAGKKCKKKSGAPQPPDAPPNAFPSVDVQISILIIKNQCSADPLPVLPMNPVA